MLRQELSADNMGAFFGWFAVSRHQAYTCGRLSLASAHNSFRRTTDPGARKIGTQGQPRRSTMHLGQPCAFSVFERVVSTAQATMAGASNQAAGTAPAFSLKGDAVLVLDSGTELTVHSTFLEMRSEVLAEAVSLAKAKTGTSSTLWVPLPAVSDAAAELLVRVLYGQEPETLLTKLAIPQLMELAHLSHRYAMTGLRSMIDKVPAPCSWTPCLKSCLISSLTQALAAKCSPDSSTCKLSPEAALSTCREARQLNLQTCEEQCLAFIARHAKAVARADPEDFTSIVLARAIAGRCQGTTEQEVTLAFRQAHHELRTGISGRVCLDNLQRALDRAPKLSLYSMSARCRG